MRFASLLSGWISYCHSSKFTGKEPGNYMEDCQIYGVKVHFLHTQSRENLFVYETSNTTLLAI